MWRSDGVLAAGCAELARAAMVAHQRRLVCLLFWFLPVVVKEV